MLSEYTGGFDSALHRLLPEYRRSSAKSGKQLKSEPMRGPLNPYHPRNLRKKLATRPSTKQDPQELQLPARNGAMILRDYRNLALADWSCSMKLISLMGHPETTLIPSPNTKPPTPGSHKCILCHAGGRGGRVCYWGKVSTVIFELAIGSHLQPCDPDLMLQEAWISLQASEAMGSVEAPAAAGSLAHQICGQKSLIRRIYGILRADEGGTHLGKFS